MLFEFLLVVGVFSNLMLSLILWRKITEQGMQNGRLRGVMDKLLDMYNRDAKALADVLKMPPQHHVALPLQVFLRAYRRLQEKEAAKGAGSKVALPAPKFDTRELKSIVEIMAEQEAAVSGAPDSEVKL